MNKSDQETFETFAKTIFHGTAQAPMAV